MNALTLIDVLEAHAATRPGTVAYRYLEDGERETATLTFAEIIEQAKQVAAYLCRSDMQGRCVVLAIRHELAFLQALLGCFYAGAIAVPAAIPKRDSDAVAFRHMAANATATTLLLSRRDEKLHGTLLASTRDFTTLYCEDAPTASSRLAVSVQPDDLAFLQYTSGSTGTPKGVQVTHANLLANERAIQQAMRLGDETIFISWLPLFHDMGLVGSALQPLFLGVTCVLMPPQAFLMKPVRWLNAISRYRGTTSGAPNFAYDLCVDKTSEAQRTALDLSSWTVAFNGSEPVRPATLERFASAFATAGYKRGSFYPCYGMAESTLIVSGPVPGTEPLVQYFQPESLQLGMRSELAEKSDAATAIVACGKAVLDTEIVIVDPKTSRAVQDGYVGELWIKGPSVTSGYFAAPDKTAAALGVLQSEAAPRFIRTGDLGCLRDGYLFVLGRLKDIVIIRGRKYYPQDLEATAGLSNPLLAAGGGAAFSIQQERGESLAVVHELTRLGWRTADPEQVRSDIREALTCEHGIAPAVVVLIKPGMLPRTTSGKVRRALCRELLLADEFEQLTEQAIESVEAPDATNVSSIAVSSQAAVGQSQGKGI